MSTPLSRENENVPNASSSPVDVPSMEMRGNEAVLMKSSIWKWSRSPSVGCLKTSLPRSLSALSAVGQVGSSQSPGFSLCSLELVNAAPLPPHPAETFSEGGEV